MVKYPQNITQAIKILDNYDPKWANKIDIDTLDMDDSENCVLGQIFEGKVESYDEDGWTVGLKTLFGIDVELDDDRIYGSDNIFGDSASLITWIKAIRKRVKEKIYEVKIKGRKTKLTQKEANELYDTLDSLAGN